MGIGAGILLKLIGVGNFLLGIAKAIFKFLGELLKAILDWAGKHPLLAAAIAVDIVLLAGCWWGYRQHEQSVAKDATITQLNQTVKQKDTLIDTLYTRLKQYADALTQSRAETVKTIQDNNKAVENLKKTAEKQIAEAQHQAQLSKKQRDQYFILSEKYRHALHTGGTPEQRIASEEKINREFIRDFQGVRK